MTAPPRPAPPGWRPAPGHQWTAVQDSGELAGRWRIADGARRCRAFIADRRTCGRPAAVELDRGLHTRTRGRVSAWWGYCPDHMYGRWVEAGKIMVWVQRPIGDTGGGGQR